MIMHPECVPCLLGRVLYETNLIDKKLAYKTMRECTKILSEEFTEGVNSAVVATKVHRKAYELLGVQDPYEKLKIESTKVAYQLFPRAQLFVEKSSNRFESAIICSIAGNVLDFGIAGLSTPYALLGEFDKICKEGISHNDLPAVTQILERAKNIVYVLDNCGEIVFDQLVLAELKRFNLNVTLVAREVPILTDATISDVQKVGLDKLATEVISTGHFAVGVDFQKVSKEFKKKLDRADLIISKGMANYESFSDAPYKPIVYILRAKCTPVANSMDVKKDKNVVKLYE